MHKLGLILLFAAGTALALDVNTVFSEQAKSAFPDTAELRVRTTVTIPGQVPYQMDMKLLTKGKSKMVSEIRSSIVNIKMVRNGNKVSAVDLKTGKSAPTQDIPMGPEQLFDLEKLMGSTSDYSSPVRVDSLWRVDPIVNGKPILYYQDKIRRIVKMVLKSGQGVVTETDLTYCSASCSLPGSLKVLDIVSLVPGQVDTKIKVEVLQAQKRSSIPDAVFTVQDN